MNSGLDIPTFKTLDTDPVGTLTRLTEYIQQMELLFKLVFRKADGTAFTPSDEEKKAMLLLKGGGDMRNLFTHVGKVEDADTYAAAVKKIKDGLTARTNQVVQRNMLFANHPQGTKSFERWSQEVSNKAKLIDYNNYNWETAAVDSIIMQTSNAKLRERALQDNVTYDQLIKLGISKEQSAKGAAMLEKASGVSVSETASTEEQVRRLQFENNKLRSQVGKQQSKDCGKCGRNDCQQGKKCYAFGEECSKCHKKNHYSRVCRTAISNKKKKNTRVRQIDDSDSDSDESISCLIEVNKIGKSDISANVHIRVGETDPPTAIPVQDRHRSKVYHSDNNRLEKGQPQR